MAAPSLPPVLAITGLSLRFGGLAVLQEVDCTVQRGEIRAVIGPNGAGKTSTLNCINGLYMPHAGSIRLDGEELLGRRPHVIAAMGVARTFQNVGVFPELSVLDNVLLGRHLQMRAGFLAGALWVGRSRGEESKHRDHCYELLDLFGLGPHAHEAAGNLPYGKQKQVDVVRAVAMRPKLLLMDEPVAGMSQTEKDDMAVQIGTIKTELDVSVLLIDHDMRFIMGLSDSVLVLDFGAVLADGKPRDIRADPAVVEAYLGSAATTKNRHAYCDRATPEEST